MSRAAKGQSNDPRALAGLCVALVGVVGGLGHLGIAFLLIFIAPIPATFAELARRRRRGDAYFGWLGALSITVVQRRFFTTWGLYTAFLLLSVLAGIVGAVIHEIVS